MNALSLPLESLIEDTQSLAAEQYQKLLVAQSALHATQLEYTGLCCELAALHELQNSLKRIFTTSPASPKGVTA